MKRLARGGRIDRSRSLRFRFDGRELTGFAGDSLASALLANGIDLVGRSIKYHRPRGLFGAGEEEPNAVVEIGEPDRSLPNLKATTIELYDGLVARSVNAWPRLDFDLGAALDWLHPILPAGFYYKTFKGIGGLLGWRFWEPWIRRAAGLGRLPNVADSDRYMRRHLHADLVVVGAGPAGIAAAKKAVSEGRKVVLADDQPLPGGSLLAHDPAFDPEACARDLTDLGIAYLRRTTVFGFHDHNSLVAVERITDHVSPADRGTLPRQRLWHIRAGGVVLATGALERPLAFPDNDRPGVMLLSAAATYVGRWAVLPGRRAVIFTNNDSAYGMAERIAASGLEIATVVDTRSAAGRLSQLPVTEGSEIIAVRGRRRVNSVRLSDGRDIACDTILVSGGWNPTLQLFGQSGGALRWDENRACFLPGKSPQGVCAIGAAAGDFGPEYAMSPHWRGRGRGRQWIDLQSDVTDRDIDLAARENLVSVEHLKRYTTAGMSSDQGRTSNVGALALLGLVTGRSPDEVGTTRFRPPYIPVSLAAIAHGSQRDLHAPRRHVPAHRAHIALGAAMEDFGGWQRPDVYVALDEDRETAARREHLAVRTRVGLFESSPIGKVEIVGPDAAKLLDRIYATPMASLPVGRIRYGLMLNENGVITDDGVCARLASDHYLLCPTSGGASRITAWIEEWLQCEFVDYRVQIADVTTAWAAFAVAGPQARALIGRLPLDIDLTPKAFRHMDFREGCLAGAPVRLLRVSFSGELQYEIQIPASYGESLWSLLIETGREFDAAPIGIEAWLRLRLEKGYIHLGSDTDGMTVPDDVGLGDAIARRQDDFIGKRSLSRTAVVQGDREQLVGLRDPSPRFVIPVGACAFDSDRFTPPLPRAGRVTSSCWSPVLGAPLALAMIRNGRTRIGQRIKFWSEGQIWDAEIASPVFYDPGGERLRG